MSLYNLLFGVNEASPILMMMAGVKPEEVARFRDCYIDNGNIVIYTRTGGGNRECFADDGDCSGCYHSLNDALTAKPNYVTDYDDDFDCTYAYFVFKPLEQYEEMFEGISNNDPGVGDKFKALIEKMKSASTST